MTRFERQHRTAPSHCFNGGHRGHGPIQSALDDYRTQVGPVRPALLAGAFVCALVGVCVLGMAVVVQ